MEQKILLSIPGGAGVYPAGFGMAVALREQLLLQARRIDQTRGTAQRVERVWQEPQIEYGGVSSGSLVALFLAAGYRFSPRVDSKNSIVDPLEVGTYAHFEKQFDRFWHVPSTYLFPAIRKFLTHTLRSDIHTVVSGKLHIGITRFGLTGPRFEVISTFTSREDLIDAIITSCTIPPFAWCPVRWYRGGLAADGCLMHNEVVLPGYANYVTKYRHLDLPLEVKNPRVLTIRDYVPSPCVTKYERLFRGAYWRTQEVLRRYHAEMFRVYPQLVTAPLWQRFARWVAPRGLGGYLLIYWLRDQPRLYGQTALFLGAGYITRLLYKWMQHGTHYKWAFVLWFSCFATNRYAYEYVQKMVNLCLPRPLARFLLA
ncbi:Hypothetical protein POVN_LOCUS245 [uncultured virus]|nr:Hypothetical protein POVN_LOCUS245 [uncultured virus]